MTQTPMKMHTSVHTRCMGAFMYMNCALMSIGRVGYSKRGLYF